MSLKVPLEFAGTNPTKSSFRQRFSNELLEGLLSKGYVRVDNEHLNLTLQGVKCLLDAEGKGHLYTSKGKEFGRA